MNGPNQAIETDAKGRRGSSPRRSASIQGSSLGSATIHSGYTGWSWEEDYE
jgi:hypothetical protein